MKILKYYLKAQVNTGTEEEPIMQTVQGAVVEMQTNDTNYAANLTVAQSEAYNGEVTVEDVPDDRPVEEVKSEKVALSKSILAQYLSDHPLTYTDGKQYSVTQEKQNLLIGNLAAYQLEVTVNPDAELTWNSVGDVCVPWTIENLSALAVAIKSYVKPMVKKQQEIEVVINSCTTCAEVEAVVIDYDVGGAE